MLRELYIKNYALIEELTIQFTPNLNVLSGETGAGKSIIVGALGLILGDKAKTSLIRTGSDSCVVEGRFVLPTGHPVYRALEESGVDCSGRDELVVRRIISSAGTSRSFVNGQQVGVRELGGITDLLVDIHGQHEHQSLLTVRNHLALLDQYGDLGPDLERYRECYRRVRELDAQIERLTMDEREKERRMDILRHAVSEIERAELRDSEDEELEQEYRVLKNYERLVTAVGGAYELLRAGEPSAAGLLEQAVEQVRGVSGVAEDIRRVAEELESARVVIDDSAHTLQSYVEGIEYEPGRIDRIQGRIELIKGLKKKYGDTIEQVAGYRDRCVRELEELESNEESIRALSEERSRELERARALAVELSARRRVAARTLAESVMGELSYLHLDKARFAVRVRYRESEDGQVTIDGKRYRLVESGLDEVEFMISTNPGEPLMPLRNVASGGELSRIMLAIKTVLGNADPIVTFVFDEIDAGIGGKTAWAVGVRMRDMAAAKQVLCVTHQAQIASRADRNIHVSKASRDGRTVTLVTVLEGEDRVREVARMISGDRISEAALRQAAQMLAAE
jgi:DNA repair protein RecN (Recombination protein N)